MKRFFAFFLCLLLIFNMSVPALASEHSAYIEYDDYIIGYDETAVQPYALAETLGLAGLGGAGTVAGAPVLAVLACIVGAGIIIYNVPLMCEIANDVYASLSEVTQEFFENWAASGERVLHLSDEIRADVYAALSQVVVYDGAIRDYVDLTFDPSVLIEYSPSYLVPGDYSDGRYNAEVFPDVMSLDGTSVTTSAGLVASIVTNDFNSTYDYALRLYNATTGVTGYYTIKDNLFSLSSSTGQVFLSRPMVFETFVDDTGKTCYRVGYYVMYVDAASDQLVYRQVDDTLPCVIEGLDNEFFTSADILTWQYYSNSGYAVFREGTSVADTSYPTFSGTIATHATVHAPALTLDGVSATLDLPEQVYAPTAEMTLSIEDYTSAYALTGEQASTGEGTDTETGFWATLWGWLSDILNAIKSLPQLIANAIAALFIPSDGFFDGFIADISDLFEDRMGILTYPLSLLYNFFDHLLDVGDEEPIFRWPSWSYQDTEFLPAGSFNFNDILENDMFATIHEIYLLLVDVGIVWGLVSLLRKKSDSILLH